MGGTMIGGMPLNKNGVEEKGVREYHYIWAASQHSEWNQFYERNPSNLICDDKEGISCKNDLVSSQMKIRDKNKLYFAMAD